MAGLFDYIVKTTKRLMGGTVRASAATALLLMGAATAPTAWATTYTETVPGGNGAIPNTYPPVGGTMFVFVGANGNLYYQFVNPSTQFEGFQNTGAPVGYQSPVNPIPGDASSGAADPQLFQLGPQQNLNCGTVSCTDYFGGSIVEGYARLTARDGDTCPGNFDQNRITFLVNGIDVVNWTGLSANSVERTNFAGTTSLGFEDCFRNQGATETSTGWFDLTAVPGLLSDVLTRGFTVPVIRDTTPNNNRWFFRDGNDATGTPEVAPGITIEKMADRTSYTAVGDVINYSFLVTNIGSVQLNDIVVDDSFITGTVVCPLTTLATGEDMTCTGEHIVTQANIDDDITFINTANVTANPSEGQLGNVSGTLEIPGPAADPAVTITKTASQSSNAQVGDVITYTYVVENTGNITIDNVAVSDVHSGTGPLSAITPASVTLAPSDPPQTFTATYTVTQDDIDAGTPITNTATPSGDPKRGTLTPPSDDAEVTVATPKADFTKVADITTNLMVGDVVTYTYTVTNTGSVDLTNVSVSDAHSGAGTLSAITPASVGTLAVGESATFTATYTVKQADIDAATPITNIATVSATPPGGTFPPTTADESVTTETSAPELSIVKRAIDTDFAAVGDVLSYEYDVENTGNVTISAITVADDKIPSVSCPVMTLAPTETTTCTGTYSVTQADLDAGSVTNIANASGTPADGTLPPATDTATVDGTQSPALTTVKRALTLDFTAVGDVLNYEYDVTNTGNVTITSPITVTDDKIPSVTCPALPTGGLLPMATLTCAGSYTVTQADLDAGEVTNIASATDGTTTSPDDDATVDGDQAPAMTIVKTANETDFNMVGDILTYDYTVVNTGNVFIADLVVTDDKISNVICNVTTIGNGDANLDPAETVVCTGQYSVTQADLDAGFVTNLASATGTPPGGTLTDPEATETVSADQMPAMTLVKASGNNSFDAVGDVLSYTYTVENTGNVLIGALDVSDDKIANVVCDVPAIGNNDANLDPGEVVVCTGDYTVTQADLDAGEVTNNASATGTPPGGTLTPPTDDLTIDADQQPSMETVKTAIDVNFELPGDVTTYEYVVTNTGNVTITAPITVTDNLIPAVNCPALPAGGLVPTASLTCTGEYTATQADLDAGQVTNLASSSDGTTSSPTTSETIPADQNPALSIVKTPLFTDFTSAGDVVTYEFAVTNDGNITLTEGVDVQDDKIGTITCFTGNLIPGATTTCQATYTITQADMDAGEVTNEAYAESDGIVSAPVDATVDGTTSPSLGFVKRAVTTDFNVAGDVINYEFDVENTGNVTLTGVSVTDDIIASVVCPQTVLAPAATMVCTGSYTVTQADVDAGEVINNASGSGNPPGGEPPVETPDSTTVDSTADSELTFVKRALSTDFTAVGDILNFEFDVENTGAITLSNIVISDDLVASVSCPATTLAPATSMVCFASYTVTQADLDAGEVVNNASADATLPDGSDIPTETDTATVEGSPSPELDVQKTALTTSYNAVGDTLDFEITVTNIGNVTITNILVDDPLIPALSCPATVLAPTDNFVCTGSYTVTQADLDAGQVDNTATVTGTPPTGTLPPETAEETVDADVEPELTIVKTALTANFDAVGDTVDYEYLVTNTGNVTLTGTISVSDDRISSVSCPVPPAGGLAPTASLTCMATYVVTQADLDAGEVTNIASATDGTTTSDDVSETVDAVQGPSLAMTKTATPQSFAAVGDVVSYEYVITNTGNVTLTDPISVSDDQIASVTCPALPPAGLVPNASLTCTATDTITQADIDAGSLTNTASGSSGGTTSPPVSETVNADQMPALETVKTATMVNFENPGDITTYEYVVTNTGNVTITAPITVTDNLISNVICPAVPAGGLLPSESLTCTGEYTATQADLDAGSVTNLASASDGTTTSPLTSETIPADQDPALTIVKTALFTDFVAAGDVVDYEFEVTNTGNLTLTGGITVEDDKIGTIPCISGNLTPGASQICTASYTITQADVDAGEVTNQAYAENGTSVSPPDDVTVEGTQSPELTLVKTALTTEYAAVGDTLDYEYVVTNSGNTTIISAITINDDQIVTVNCPALPAGGLLPGGSLTCTATDTITQADLDAGEVTNTASATDGTTDSADETATVTGESNEGVEIDKVARSNDFSEVGDILFYDYIVRNTGNVTLTDPVTVSDDRIANVVCPTNTGLVPGATLTCTGEYTVVQADLDEGSVTNIATATVGDTTSDPDTVVITGTQEPSLGVEKSSSAATISFAGETVPYNYLVTNTGNVVITSAITIDDDKISNVICPALPAGGLQPGASLTCSADYTVSQSDLDAGFVTNIATASSDVDGAPVTSDPDTVTIDADITRDLDVVKTATTESFMMPGDVISYTYVVTNTGNETMVEPITISDDRIPSVSCPALPAGGLVPGASLTCTADYTATQDDVDEGSVTNLATASTTVDGEDVTSSEVSETVEANVEPRLDVIKTTVASRQLFGPIFEVEYALGLENSGNITLTNIQLEDDLAVAFAPAVIAGTPVVTSSDFAVNASYDGVSLIDLLTGTDSLAVGENGSLSLIARLDITNGGPTQGNTANGQSDEISTPVPSDDPNVTPGTPGDTNPAPLSLEDTDSDGVPDSFESGTDDRDGDGIPDSEDYDPTGYFYCEENGAILPGGSISVTGPVGSNSAVGLSNNINIVQDGSNGFFQFYVTEPGLYTLTPTYPTSGEPSTTRLPSANPLDVSTRTDNPAVLGSSEVASTGVIGDFTAGANSPFYFAFDIEAGDPSVFMNNIPMQSCGIPAVDLTKTVMGDPDRLEDGRQTVTYDFTVVNSGEVSISQIELSDDLSAVFGTQMVEVSSLVISDSPTGFTGTANGAFDGAANLGLLNGSGVLQPGQNVTLSLTVFVATNEAGAFMNTASVTAQGPLNTGEVTDADTAEVTLAPLSDASFLRVRKTASPRTVQIGDPVLYTISVTNESASTLSGVDIVDRLPDGFAYVPNSSSVSDAAGTVGIEPTVRGPGVLSWSLGGTQPAPLDALLPGETVSVSLRLLAGPNVTFGAHENQAFAENTADGSRSEIATASVDFIPEPSFDCTPVIGRVYDDVNVNGYPDDGEPGLPGVRLVTVNGDIITTDEYGRYHIPCAAIADAENGSNFLLKADTRTLPLGYAPTTENPRVVRVTRGKFVKMNFGAGFRTKLRVDFQMSDFSADGTGIAAPKVAELASFLALNQTAERAVLVYHADEDMSVDAAQARLQTALDAVRDLGPRSLRDIALEALWKNTDGDEGYELTDRRKRLLDKHGAVGGIAGETFGPAISGETINDNGRRNGTDRQVFGVNANGDVSPISRDEIPDRSEDRRWSRNAGLRDSHGDEDGDKLSGDTRDNRASFLGRRDRVGEADRSPAPGRLQRWLGWGNSTSAYVDAMEIETTVDSLDPVKRLNAHMEIVSENGQRVLKAATYSNYVAFAGDFEIRVFDARRSARGEPILVIPVRGNVATAALPEGLPYGLQYVLRAKASDGSFDQTAPKGLRIGDADFDLTPAEWLERASGTYGQNTLETSNVRVRGGSVRVYGRNVPGEMAVVMGEAVRIDSDGRFVAEQLLPAGLQSVTVDAGLQKLVRSVDVKSRDTFYVAQIEASVGERIGDAEMFEEGRVAFYVRSRLNDRWTVTATADTGEAGLGDLVSTLDDKDLNQLLRRLDPDRYYPTYGDNSDIEQDAPTSGRIYARIERDDDYALWGNYQTNFNDTEFARVNRTLYGAKLHWDENAFTTLGDARTELTAFIAEGGSRQARDELRGTGGSVYYLRHGDISIGSEQLRVETRDSVSGLVIESRRLQYGSDYDLDFIQGRVILTRPLGSTGDDGRLFRDGSQSGNAQVLVADYEYSPVFGGDETGAVYGGRAKRWFGDHIKLGATYNHSDEGGVESDLYEMDLTLQYAAGTYVKGEIARSEGIGVETFTSVDGGFTYNAADRGGVTTGNDLTAMAYAVEAAVNFSEVSGLDGNAYAYWRKRQAGFAGYSEATNQAVEQFGGGMEIALARGLDLGARADISDNALSGTNSFAEARLDYALNEKATLSAGLSYNEDRVGNSGTSLGLRGEHKFGNDGKLYAFGQVGLTGENSRTTDRIGAGGEVRLSKTLFGGGEVSTGEDGLGLRASLRREEEDGDEYYLAYDLPLRAQPTGNYGTLNVGARKRFTEALSVFGEERMQFNDRGLNGITHAYGVDWSPGNWNLGFSGEVGRIDSLDREAIALSAGFADERFKAGFAAEYREDENINTQDKRNTWLLRWTSQYQASEELRLQGKFNRAFSKQTQNGTFGPLDFNEAEFTEGSIAAAYRPIWDDRFNLLAKYTYLEDLSPTSQRFGGETLNYRQKSEIISIDTAFDVSPKWTLGGKYAHRSGSVTADRQSLNFTKSTADLGVLRLDYHVTHQWDMHLEGRYLNIGDGVITRLGGQAGVYRHMNDHAKLGIGITWGGIEEQYLAAIADENDIGWYLNLIGKF